MANKAPKSINKTFRIRRYNNQLTLILFSTFLVGCLVVWLSFQFFTLYSSYGKHFGFQLNSAKDPVSSIEEIFQTHLALDNAHIAALTFAASRIDRDEFLEAVDAYEATLSTFKPNSPVGQRFVGMESYSDALASSMRYVDVLRRFEGSRDLDEINQQFHTTYLAVSLFNSDAIKSSGTAPLRLATTEALRLGLYFSFFFIFVLVAFVFMVKSMLKLQATKFAQLQLLLSSIAHDLRSPLQSIENATLLLSADLTAEVRKKYISAIRTSAASVARLVDDVLSVMRQQSVKVKPSQVDLAQWVYDFSSVYRPKAESKGLSWLFTTQILSPQPVLVDSARLVQCVGNLVDNAIRYTDAGKISINLDCREGLDKDKAQLTIRVTDTGCGIHDKDKRRIFLPFERAVSDPEKPGMGLGLSIVNRFALAMNGRVLLEQTSLGFGSTFRLELELDVPPSLQSFTHSVPPLPLVDAGASHTETQTYTSVDEPGKTVLVVDDDPEILASLAEMLTTQHIRVKTARDGLEASRMLTTHHFDVVLTDIHMPGMSGFALAVLVRTHHPKTLILAMTAASEQFEQSPEAKNFHALLRKPFSLHDLLGKLAP